MAILNIVTCVLICVGIGFAILSTVGNYWLVLSLSFYSMHSGLWSVCNNNYCADMTNVSDIINVTRAFMIIGCVSYSVAFVSSFLIYAKKIKNHKISGALLCATDNGPVQVLLNIPNHAKLYSWR
ncbi:lens fiber membrane intrinsic protein-like isoform X2 [Hydra vulgaris]|uniref:Lens fiber membrane intrinsic protein-like isoform X2 n=1 Tax=Hydra vulgaris TaxID=6087 RepID=A0ABM4DGD7_HYDVU